MIGELRAQLQALGVAQNTYFVFSSDNGYHMGERRLLSGKQTAWDHDVRVPLVVAGPGVPAGATVGAARRQRRPATHVPGAGRRADRPADRGPLARSVPARDAAAGVARR